MSRRPALVTEADIRRAAKVAKSLGEAWFVEISKDGAIRVAQYGAQDRAPGRDPQAGLAREHDWRL